MNQGNFFIIKEHNEKIEQWKIECKKKIEKSKMKKYRTKQYQNVLNDNKAYTFYLTRNQTRYKQRNYIRTSYKVAVTVAYFSCSYDYLFI